MNVGKTTIRNNEIRNNAPVPLLYLGTGALFLISLFLMVVFPREERLREGKADSVLHVVAEECSRSGISKKDIV
jgi:hypothetical protein